MKQKGFTLIELIIVIAIIAVLAGAVFVALNPAKRFQDSRNTRRLSDTNAIIDAVLTHQADNDGVLASGIDSTLRMIGTAVSGCSVSCGIGTTGTVSVRVAASHDDAEERNPPNGSMSRWSADLELVNDGSTDQEVGMRFQNITIPQGTTITNAYIEFTVDETDSGATSVVFYGEDIDDAPYFSNSNGNITNRTRTTASVNWSNIVAWTSVGATHQTPDLSLIIQEIVNRSGWTSGNSLVITVDGTGERTAESYNGSASSAPLLVIEYGTGGAEMTPSACLDLSASLDGYLGTIPVDPLTGSDAKTYYGIKALLPSGIKVVACSPEDNEIIEITR